MIERLAAIPRADRARVHVLDAGRLHARADAARRQRGCARDHFSVRRRGAAGRGLRAGRARRSHHRLGGGARARRHAAGRHRARGRSRRPVRRAGLGVGYAGRAGSRQPRGDRCRRPRRRGRARSSLYRPGEALAHVASRLWRAARVPGRARCRRAREGRSAVDGLLAARRPGDLVLRGPAAAAAPRRRLLAAGAAGLEGRQRRCARTRPAPTASSPPTDIAPTRARASRRSPCPMRSPASRSRPPATRAPPTSTTGGRGCAVVGPRRWPVMLGGLGSRSALLAAWALARALRERTPAAGRPRSRCRRLCGCPRCCC